MAFAPPPKIYILLVLKMDCGLPPSPRPAPKNTFNRYGKKCGLPPPRRPAPKNTFNRYRKECGLPPPRRPAPKNTFNRFGTTARGLVGGVGRGWLGAFISLLWLAASLQLKNFCMAYSFDPKLHESKNKVYNFLYDKLIKFCPSLGYWEFCQR